MLENEHILDKTRAIHLYALTKRFFLAAEKTYMDTHSARGIDTLYSICNTLDWSFIFEAIRILELQPIHHQGNVEEREKEE